MFRRILKLSVVLFLLIAILSAGLFYREYTRPRAMIDPSVLFEVEKGKGWRAVAEDLKAKGILQGRIFLFLASSRIFHSSEKIKAGEYFFSSPVSIRDVIRTMTRGKVYLHSVTIPEGLTSREIVPLVHPLSSEDEEQFVAAFRNTEMLAGWDDEAKDLEGYLFPETYHFPKGVAAHEIIGSMVEQFKRVFDEARRLRAQQLGMSVRQVVILASLIEKETSLAEEKRLVSAVFHNRLRIGMKLDCDPTIIFGLKLKGAYEGRLRSSDLEWDSPYNTYRHAGLPPGPICNPGLESLDAALRPAPENYLYFVSKNDGSHYFSRSFAEHQQAVWNFQKRKASNRDRSGQTDGSSGRTQNNREKAKSLADLSWRATKGSAANSLKLLKSPCFTQS